MTVLEKEKINDIAQRQVVSALREILSDPDTGLNLTTRFVRKIKKSSKSKEFGKTNNLLDVLAKYR